MINLSEIGHARIQYILQYVSKEQFLDYYNEDIAAYEFTVDPNTPLTLKKALLMGNQYEISLAVDLCQYPDSSIFRAINRSPDDMNTIIVEELHESNAYQALQYFRLLHDMYGCDGALEIISQKSKLLWFMCAHVDEYYETELRLEAYLSNLVNEYNTAHPINSEPVNEVVYEERDVTINKDVIYDFCRDTNIAREPMSVDYIKSWLCQ
jgi:hypothetical protein